MKLQTKVYLFLIAVLGFNLFTMPGQTDWGDDYAQYLSQAQAIVSHHFDPLIQQTNVRQLYTTTRIGPSYYPWGFPLLISPIIASFGVNLAALQMYLYLFYAAFLVVLWHLFKEKLEPGAACLLVALFSLNPFMFQFNRSILSDVPFLLFCTLLICLIQRFLLEKRYVFNRPFSYVLLGGVAFAGLFVRTVGVVALPLLLGCQVIEGIKEKRRVKKREYLVELIPHLVVALLFGLSHFAFRQTVASYSSKDVGAENTIRLIVGNIAYYLQVGADFYKGPKVLQSILLWLTLPVMFLGIFKNWRKDYHYLLFCAGYFAVVLLIPYQQGARYVFPLWPFYFYFLFLGAASLKLPFKTSPVVLFALPIACYFAVVTAYFGYQTAIKRKLTFDGPYVQEGREMFNYINAKTASSALINCMKPRLMSLTTGRVSVYQEDDDKLNQFSEVYTVVDKTLQTPPVRMGSKYELVFSNSRFDIFKKTAPAPQN